MRRKTRAGKLESGIKMVIVTKTLKNTKNFCVFIKSTSLSYQLFPDPVQNTRKLLSIKVCTTCFSLRWTFAKNLKSFLRVAGDRWYKWGEKNKGLYGRENKSLRKKTDLYRINPSSKLCAIFYQSFSSCSMPIFFFRIMR